MDNWRQDGGVQTGSRTDPPPSPVRRAIWIALAVGAVVALFWFFTSRSGIVKPDLMVQLTGAHQNDDGELETNWSVFNEGAGLVRCDSAGGHRRLPARR